MTARQYGEKVAGLVRLTRSLRRSSFASVGNAVGSGAPHP